MNPRVLLSDNTTVWIRGALARLGIEIGTYSGSFAQHRAELIIGKVATVWDLGAHVGQYGARLLSHGCRGRIVSVGPSDHSFAQLSRRARRQSGWTVAQVAISDATGRVSLNISANGQSSSLLPMEPLHIAALPNSRYIGSEIIQATTLDLLPAELNMLPPLYIKLDLQGGELAAWRGATEVLSATNA